ncbi:MAG: 5-formyltetrahydrofolate cyclo-ligase [Burkholderiales bacterium]|nr:5-formyltetrahydrofolate cyclo-ligase [Burkholderiales bacterium]PZN02631.1 MAG: 5-formyltetrahydrofolate cyclo-ligase [Pseudomonadota bacterium]
MPLSRALSIWRRNLRATMIETRLSIPEQDRRKWNDAITQSLIRHFPQLASMRIGFYWPFKGEVDGRHAIRYFRMSGANVALPRVVAKGEPLQFFEWWPGAPMRRGVWDIPYPEGTRRIVPQALFIAPVAFDEAGYRLGYGGGYYDRTLAAMSPQPLKIALAFEASRIATIHPQAHDIPMDFVVTEQGVYHAGPNGLVRLGCSRESLRRTEQILRQRLAESARLGALA